MTNSMDSIYVLENNCKFIRNRLKYDLFNNSLAFIPQPISANDYALSRYGGLWKINRPTGRKRSCFILYVFLIQFHTHSR